MTLPYSSVLIEFVMPNEKNLREVLLRNKETKDLDYKGPCSWNPRSKAPLCELVKDVLALGNTLGGFLVIGVQETPSGFDFVGLTDDQMATFDTTKVNQFVNKYADPPVNLSVNKVTHEDKKFVIIGVPRFPDTPHICQKSFPDILAEGAVYVRTDNNESAPIKKSCDFRLLLENAIKNRSEQLLTSMRTILKHGYELEEAESSDTRFLRQVDLARKRSDDFNPYIENNYGYRETVFFPDIYDEELLQIPQLRTMAARSSINYTGWPFIYFDEHESTQSYTVEDGIETLLTGQNMFDGGDEFHFWRLFRSGLLYAKEILYEDSYLRAKGNSDLVLDFDRLCQMAGKAVDCLGRLYSDELEDDNDITLILKLTGLKNRSIGSLFGIRRLLRGIYTSKIDEIVYKKTQPLAVWKAGRIDHAVDICGYVLIRFNWQHFNVLAIRRVIEDMYQRR